MPNRIRNDKTMVKNTADFHPEDEDLDLERHHDREAPIAAVPAGTSPLDATPDVLRGMSLEELRERAGQLAIEGHRDMDRESLIDALTAWREKAHDRLH